MDAVHARAADFLRRFGIPRDTPVLVAVSGGADSMALLHVLAAVGQRVGAGHVHHGLRGAAADSDREFVGAAARMLGVPFASRSVDARARDGRSPEARARALRYRALAALRDRGGYRLVATAHTVEDQAETVLLRAIRGTGPAGLAGIEPCGDDGRIRPFLEVRREALRGYLGDRGIEWREDASNADLEVPRNRLRRCVLPELERAHPGAIGKLAELAALGRETRDLFDALLEPVLERALRREHAGLELQVETLRGLPEPLRLQALSRALCELGLAEEVTRVHLRRMAAFLERPRGGTLSLPRGVVLRKRGGRAWLGPAPRPRESSPDPGPMRGSVAKRSAGAERGSGSLLESVRVSRGWRRIRAALPARARGPRATDPEVG
ncbi:MAG: tRNA lysidine(34) synthetase TilS [Myxococcota bacterium]